MKIGKIVRRSATLAGICGLLLLNSCERSATPSLYVEDQSSAARPVITAMSPAGKTLAGIGTITVTGQNFSTDREDNTVFFDAEQLEVVSASSTELVVVSPNIAAKDSYEVRIGVKGSFEFSDPQIYGLEPAIESYGGFSVVDVLYGVCVDPNGNVYVARQPREIWRVTQDTTEFYGTTLSGFINALQLRWGPGGYLYAARNIQRIVRIPPGGGNSELIVNASGKSFNDLDFDQAGGFYTVGNMDSVYYQTSAGDLRNVSPYLGVTMKTVRVFNGFVYVAGEDDNGSNFVWRNPITGDGVLGASEEVFNVTAEIDSLANVLSLNIAADGTIYLGTDSDKIPMVQVNPDGSAQQFYAGVILSDYVDSEWGNDDKLYFVRLIPPPTDDDDPIRALYEVKMQKNGAPYFGR